MMDARREDVYTIEYRLMAPLPYKVYKNGLLVQEYMLNVSAYRYIERNKQPSDIVEDNTYN